MNHFNTYYIQTLHNIKAQWQSWTESSSEKSYFDGIIFSFVYNCIMHFYIQALNEFETFWQYWKQRVINQDHPLLLTTTGESPSSVPLSDYITYNNKASSTGFQSYPTRENFNTITADTNLSDRVGFNTKTPESHSSFTSFSSDPTMIQQNNETATKSAPDYEPPSNLYQSGLDFLFPPEKITKCAISVTSSDKQQRLINFSYRIKKDWTTFHQLLESSGEIRCAQFRTGEREYTMFLFYLFTISLFLNVIYGIYQRHKYRKPQNSKVVPPNQVQENNIPDPRDNQEHIVPNPKNNQEDSIVSNPQDNQANIVSDPRGNQEDSRDNQGDPRGNQGNPLDRARVLLDRLSPLERTRLEERRNRAANRQRNYSLGTPPNS